MYTEHVKLSTKDAFVVTLSKSLQFPAAEYIREKIMKECDNLKLVVVVDGKRVGNIDSTVAKVNAALHTYNKVTPETFYYKSVLGCAFY